MAYRVRDRIRVVFWVVLALAAGMLLMPQTALAQVGKTPGDLLDTFRA